ncbi:MAG: hypothetical protein NC299_07235 [Lachnospiraceae bacterium]|nr:hypothetical protein [Ruminococcus sp.]MCM1275148.1 hypothetical protein [Lachnospiraceae bacterium]
MKRERFWILTLKGIGFVVLGNILCLIMTVAIFVFGSNTFIKALAIAFSAAIFFSLVFTVAWKNGVKERSLVKLGRAEKAPKYRWIAIGLIMFAVAAAPTVFLLINKLFFPERDNLLIYQFISGSAYPMVLTFTPQPDALVTQSSRVESMSVLFPVLMTVYYALIPVFTQLGYYLGLNDKLSSDKIMYK